MMIRGFFLTMMIFPFFLSYATPVTGTVKDENGNVLSNASVLVKGTSIAVISSASGKYALELTPGNYVLVCQYIGFKKVEKNIQIGNVAVIADFNLQIQETTMQEVVIKRGEDPAIEIIRNTIRKRDYYNKQVDSFQVDVYIKGLVQSRNMPDRMMGQRVDKQDMRKSGFDSLGRGIIFNLE
jgi:hypothetical protein